MPASTTRVYRDEDADLSCLEGRQVAVLGYGNQGRAQALNLRDSGVPVLVGSREGDAAQQAVRDGFTVVPLADAARQGDILLMLLPDEVQQQVWRDHLAEGVGAGDTLVFAHGYNVTHRLIEPPEGVDVILVAPRMIGVVVRESFERGGGAPAFVGVERDASGRALQTALALARGIGATRAGVLEMSAAGETTLDNFLEQATWAAIMRVFLLSFEVLVEAGFPPEAVTLELYGSQEAAEICREMAEVGFFRQMAFHSRTSQYGSLSRGKWIAGEEMRDRMRRALAEVRSGSFAREWALEQEMGYPVFDSLHSEVMDHPLNQAEERMRAWLAALRGEE